MGPRRRCTVRSTACAARPPCISATATGSKRTCAGRIRWARSGASTRRSFPALNASRVQQVSLEYAASRVPGHLINLLPDKQLLIGAIGVTGDRVESPEEVAATLRAALQFADNERVLACTNCGMAPLSREVALSKLISLARGAALVRS